MIRGPEINRIGQKFRHINIDHVIETHEESRFWKEPCLTLDQLVSGSTRRADAGRPAGAANVTNTAVRLVGSADPDHHRRRPPVKTGDPRFMPPPEWCRAPRTLDLGHLGARPLHRGRGRGRESHSALRARAGTPHERRPVRLPHPI
jgi:hypothetical protein